MDGDELLARLRARLRLQGAALMFFGSVFAAMGILNMERSDKMAMLGLGSVVVAAVGLYRLLRLPIYLRRPDEIDRIDRYVPGHRDAVLVIMEDGQSCRLPVGTTDRDALVKALEQRIGAARLRARVVKR